MTIVAGQVWRRHNVTDSVYVVVGLRFDPANYETSKLQAQLVEVNAGDHLEVSHLDRREISCDALRQDFTLIYDATLIEPQVVAA